MKVITITEDNIKDVYGRLRKFFYNNSKTGFECWHNFDCGFKKHISRYVEIKNRKVRICNLYPAPIEIKLHEKCMYIAFNLTATDGDGVQIGDKIAFCGNRIIIRKKWFLPHDHNYVYTVYQAYPMDQHKQKSMLYFAEMEMRAFEKDILEGF